MALYEHVFIARPDISSQQVEGLTETFTNVIKEGGGTVGKSEYWGLRNLTYKINKNRKGHYSLLNIDAPHAAVAEMERLMGLNEDVMRFMTLKVEEHETGPSAVMQNKGGRDDRRGGGGFRGDRDDRGPRPPRHDAPEASSKPQGEASS